MHLQIKCGTNKLVLATAILLLAGCVTRPAYDSAEVETRDVFGEGDPRGYDFAVGGLDVEDLETSRARYYELLIEQLENIESKIDATLTAAEYYIQAQDFANAERMALRLHNTPLNQVQDHRWRIVSAYVAYARADYDGSLYQLQPVINYRPPLPAPLESQDAPISQVEPRLTTQQVDALLLSSLAHQALDDYSSAINALIMREGALVGSARTETTRYIWQVINSLPLERRQLIIDSTPFALVRNRVEQSLGTQFGTSTLAPQQFNQWRTDDTDADKQPISTIWNAQSARNIAVLLPLSSKYAKAARALMDGIDYQHSQNQSVYRPQLQFYDIGDNPLQATQYYFAALQSGADFVIGPLGKDNANQVNSYVGNRTPTLLLGGDNPLTGGMSRFTMGPEIEGQQVADRAWRQGHLSAALLVPEDADSQRTVNAFAQRWMEYGGKISAVITYSPRQYDHSTELKQLFAVNQSHYRHRRLSDALGFKPKFTAYQRADIDFIFMLASNATGRILRPQINFFGGADLPVYATSAVFNGIQDEVENIDLENTQFPVMPWVLRSESVAPYAGKLNMLFALGGDAYQIAGSAQQLQRNPDAVLNGHTGQVGFNAYGEAIFQPVWARFVEGMAVASDSLGIDITPINAPNNEQPGQSEVNGDYNESTWDSRNRRPRRKTGG